jgi:hypothetical protein
LEVRVDLARRRRTATGGGWRSGAAGFYFNPGFGDSEVEVGFIMTGSPFQGRANVGGGWQFGLALGPASLLEGPGWELNVNGGPGGMQSFGGSTLGVTGGLGPGTGVSGGPNYTKLFPWRGRRRTRN